MIVKFKDKGKENNSMEIGVASAMAKVINIPSTSEHRIRRICQPNMNNVSHTQCELKCQA